MLMCDRCDSMNDVCWFGDDALCETCVERAAETGPTCDDCGSPVRVSECGTKHYCHKCRTQRNGGWCVTCDAYTERWGHNDTCPTCSGKFRRMGWPGH